jgi:hypothetical protein
MDVPMRQQIPGGQLSQLTQGQSKEVQGVTITYPQPNTCVCLGLIAGFSSCALGIH